MQKTFFLTTTLPYINAPLHMGHALEFVRADTIARYKKLQGYDVYFNTGTDEHGLKIFEKAKERGMTSQDFVDQGFEVFKEQLKMFGVVSDIHYIRTTDKSHEKAAQEFWIRVRDNGYIYKKTYEAKYCVGCESEKTDSELVNEQCPLHPGQEMKVINEENYFFKYSEFRDELLDLYEKNSNFVIPEFRFNEIKNFVQNGLQDFSISRLKEKMPWGIEVPGDETQVMYVWFDALVNYISTLGWPNNLENFEKYWVNGNPTQYCGKDNTRFQSAMWQAMLMAAGLPNSHQIVVNGFITGDGGIRMSKSLGNVIDPRDIVKEYGTDALRYFLLREVGSFEDSPFTIERFKDSYNSGLANGLGNLVSRVMKMATVNNIVIDEFPTNEKVMSSEDEEFFIHSMNKFDIKHATDLLWARLQIFDGIIQKVQPFKLLKSEILEDKNNGIECVKEIMIGLYQISVLLESIIPETAKKIQELIKENKMPETPLFLRKD
ncbi:MAG TPA: methionine--tRNA ligase [Candidatus Paceibacterota bacterium]